MKLVDVYIARKQKEFACHLFFAQLEQQSAVPDVLSFAPDLTFWATRPFTRQSGPSP